MILYALAAVFPQGCWKVVWTKKNKSNKKSDATIIKSAVVDSIWANMMMSDKIH